MPVFRTSYWRGQARRLDLATKIHSFGRIWCVQVAGPEQTWRGPIRPGGETGVSSIRSHSPGARHRFVTQQYTTHCVTLLHCHTGTLRYIVTLSHAHCAMLQYTYCIAHQTHMYIWHSNFLLRLHCGTLSHHLSPLLHCVTHHLCCNTMYHCPLISTLYIKHISHT